MNDELIETFKALKMLVEAVLQFEDDYLVEEDRAACKGCDARGSFDFTNHTWIFKHDLDCPVEAFWKAVTKLKTLGGIQ